MAILWKSGMFMPGYIFALGSAAVSAQLQLQPDDSYGSQAGQSAIDRVVKAGNRPRALRDARAISSSLLQSAARMNGATKTQEGKQIQGPLAPDFFDSFAEGESTFDAEAQAKMSRSSSRYRPEKSGVKPSAFFHESQSDGPRQAFQTHYPGLQDGTAGRGGGAGAWRLDDDGQWVQDYNSYAGRVRTNEWQSLKSPGWFESNVKQFDGYGRERLPDPDSVRWMANWTERTVNTTLKCATSGCTANASLQLYDPSTEEASNCHFSLHLHATDFDDQYSGERLTFIALNGVTVNTDCYPMMSGCNQTTQQDLFGCVRQQPLENIIDADGVVTVTAQISDVVDECPYEGNLLSGVPMVTCLVRQRANTTTNLTNLTEPPIEPPVPQPPSGFENMTVFIAEPLRCMTRGCSAETELRLNRTRTKFSECLLTVKLFQTDFDNEAETFEGLEFLSVDNENKLVNVTPGGNPCRSAWNGTKLSLAEIEYPLLPPTDVTSLAADGVIKVGAKISRYVDECAHNGYLLNGMVELNCSIDHSWDRGPLLQFDEPVHG